MTPDRWRDRSTTIPSSIDEAPAGAMPAAADSDWVVVLLCILQDPRDILSVLSERDGFGTALSIAGPTGNGIGVTRMIGIDPIAGESFGWN